MLAEAKSIYSLYDTGNKWKVPSGDPEPSAYRTSTLLLPEAKSIYSLEDTGNKGGASVDTNVQIYEKQKTLSIIP